MFEHLFLSRDKKPNTELVSKRKSRVQEENTVVSHKRVHKSNEPVIKDLLHLNKLFFKLADAGRSHSLNKI